MINLSYIAAMAMIVFLALKYLIAWFWPFLSGLALAYLFRHLARGFRSRSPAVTAITGVAFYCAVILVFWLLFVVVAGRLVELSSGFPEYYEKVLLPKLSAFSGRLMEFIHRFAPDSVISLNRLFDMVSSAAQQIVSEVSSSFLSGFSTFLQRLPLFIIGFMFMIVSSFAIAMDYERVTQFLMRQLPHAARPVMLDIKNFLISCLFRLLRAYAIIMLITFSELCIGLWALRVERFWRIAAIIALLDILPLLGSGAVLVPWGILELLRQNSALGVGLIILFAVIAVVRNIIEPRIVGDSLNLHPAAALASMYFGLRVFGFAGMLAAPVTALLLRFLNEKGKIRLYRSHD